MRPELGSAAAVALACWSTAAFGQTCEPFWSGVQSAVSSTGDLQIAAFDDGSGEKLYVSGWVWQSTGYVAPGVVRWDGRVWEQLQAAYPASSVPGNLLVLNDGSGDRLHASGLNDTWPGAEWWLRVWDGQQWQPVPPGFASIEHGWPVISVDHGNGPVIYGASATQQNNVVRWNGQAWEIIAVAGNHASRFAAYDDGTGLALYVSGSFTQLNGMPFSRIARWTGDTWEPLGSGIGAQSTIRDMIVHDDGRGPALYVADVTSAGGMPINRIARWDGVNWSDVGGGGIVTSGITAVHVLGSLDDGTGASLFAGGYISMAGGGVPVRGIARFRNGVWDDMGGGVRGSIPRVMMAFDDGRGPSLFVGGAFNTVGAGAPDSARGVAQWVGCQSQCYADCDNSSIAPRLNVDDFTCFINKFSYGDPYVDCNRDGERDIDDFICFINSFSQGCP